MSRALSEGEVVREEAVKYVWQQPVTFDEFVGMCGKYDLVELIDGAVVERDMVQLDHELLQLWLVKLLGGYVEERDLGVVLGSRTPVKIGEFRGRLPDILYVRAAHVERITQKGVLAAPDLVIEVRSPGDRRADVIALEADYRTLGVAEIVFVDPQNRRVRVLSKGEAGYTEEELIDGTLALATVPGFAIEVDWLFDPQRPRVRQTLEALLAAS